jgi:hypothetical protein
MTRRRLIVVAVALALVAIGGAWWLSLDSLSAEEQKLVGTWRLSANSPGESGVWELWPNRVCRMRFQPPAPAGGYRILGRWSGRAGQLVVDSESNPIRKRLRRVIGLFGVRTGGLSGLRPEFISDDQFVFIGPDGTRQVWTRDPAG